MNTVLQRQTTHGVIWQLFEKFGLQVTRFIVTIILARLLTPADFGLIGMIMVIFAIAQVFVEAGLGSAYIQKKEVSFIDANTIFITNLVISVLMYVVVWSIAPFVAAFYEEPQLLELTRIMAFIFVINAFGVIQHSKLRREVKFKEKAIVNLIANLVSGGIAIYVALSGLGVWSIVIQFICLNILNVVGLWIVVKWIPRFEFSFDSLRKMLSFGVWMLATSILTTITDNLYILIIGKYFPAAQVGYYTKAKQFQQMGSEQFSQAIGGVAFPVLAKVQGKEQKIKLGMSSFLALSLVLVAPIMLSLHIGAQPFIKLLLTDKWLSIIPYLKILAIIGILYPIHLLNIQLTISQGRSDLIFRLNIIKIVIRIANILIMAQFGVLYIIMGELVVSTLSLYFNTYYARKSLNYGLLRQLWDTRSIWLSIIIASVLGHLIMIIISNQFIQLFSLFVTIELVFLSVQYFTNKQLLLDLWQLFFHKNPIDFERPN